MLLYRINGPRAGLGNLGSVIDDAKKCAYATGISCSNTMYELLTVSPNRDALRALGAIILGDTWLGWATHYNAIPSVLDAFDHHAPANKNYTASVLSTAILNTELESYIGGLILSLVTTLRTLSTGAASANIRAQAILNLTNLADSPSQWAPEARTALSQIAHLTTAPVPPVEPEPTEEPTVTEIIDPFTKPTIAGIPATTVAGVVGAVAIAGVLIFFAVRKRA